MFFDAYGEKVEARSLFEEGLTFDGEQLCK